MSDNTPDYRPTSSVSPPADRTTTPAHEAPENATDTVPPASEPVAEKPAIPARPVTARPAGTQNITFDDLKFDIEKDAQFERSMFTPSIEALEGGTIRIKGYIHPNVFTQTGIQQFVLVRDNQECCFGPGAAIFDCIIVHMKPGKSTDYTTRPVTVEGELTFEELRDFDDVTRAIFRMDAHLVK